MKLVHFTLLAILLISAGCSTAPLNLPEPLENFDIDSMCDDESRVTGIKIKAILDETSDHTWLAIYWEPRFYTNREPIIELTAGTAAYMGQKGKIYYYNCQELPNSRKIGRIILPKVTDKYGPARTLIDIYRRSNSQCLELREISKKSR